jgi:hypothetical protein
MERSLLLTLVVLACAWFLKAGEQRRRIALLGAFLARYRIESKMEALTQGYLRALGEQDPQRRAQVFELLRPTEEELCAELGRLAEDFGRADPRTRRVSRLPFWIPFAPALLPGASFDLREALALHARGLCRAVQDPAARSPRDRAFLISAELFLLQHTCHWFCRSRLVASARMLSQHKTSYGQLLQAVSPQTRTDYLALVGRAA